ncbi:MAG: HDOD domain-containing protein, partial [Planctomycetota bacterium]
LVSHFDGHDLTMPPMPRAAERVLARLRDSQSTMAEVARDISEDQVMAAEVLRMSNSVFYRGTEKITSLQSSVTRLGTHALRTLMMHQSLRSAMFPKSGVDRDVAERLWRRSLASGCVMRGLAEFTKLDPDDALLIGLMHDIGNVLVLRITHERQVMQTRLDWGTFEYLCFECHQEFGELIAEAWKLPSELKSLISNHHACPNPEDPLRVQRWMLMLTDMVNQMLGYDVEAQYDLMRSRPVMELGLLGRSDFEDFFGRLPEEIEEMLASLEVRK